MVDDSAAVKLSIHTTVLNTKAGNSHSIVLHALIDYIKLLNLYFLYQLKIIKQDLCFDQNNVSICIFGSTSDMFEFRTKKARHRNCI